MEPSEETQLERVGKFREVVGDDLNEETCRAILASNDWNLEATLRNFFDGPSAGAVEPTAPTASQVLGSNHPLGSDDDSGSQPGETSPFIGLGAGMRARRGGRSFSPDRDDTNESNRPRTFNLPPVPQKSLIAMVKEGITGQNPAESSGSTARRFVAEFDALVGSDASVPEFFESSFEDALLSASTERGLLVIYLHSPLHPDTDAFCREVLCSRHVLQALADVRLWGGSVHSAEGYLASMKVQATGYPCLILITTTRGRDAKVVDRLYVDDISEPNLAERFALRINAAKTIRRPVPTVDQRETDERRRVIEEQDAALRQSMEEDRRREEERRAREREAEEEKKRQLENEKRKLEEFERKKQSIRAEPPTGSAGIANIRFQFPGGSKMSRRFAEDDTLSYVRQVLDVYLNEQLKTPALRYALVLNYPKRTLDDESQTLKDAGLVPQAVIFLQDLDA